MTGYKAGVRVHVEFDADVISNSHGSGWLYLKTIDRESYCTLPLALCTLITPPLKVGDILDQDSPEPPEGTTVVSVRRDWFMPYCRMGERWFAAGALTSARWNWPTLIPIIGPVRVINLPDGAE